MAPRWLSTATLILSPAFAFATRAHAQAELQGRVLAEGGRRPIARAMVALPRLDLRTVTDSLGTYRLTNIPRGEQLVVTRAVGFRPDSTVTVFDGDETLVSDVVLRVALNELPTVAVREASRPVTRGEMAAFEEREALGVGTFIGRQLLQKNENRHLADILAANAPGVVVFHGSGSKSWATSGRTPSSSKCAMCRVTRLEMLDWMDIAAGAPLACYMDVYLDGALVYDASARQTPLFNLNSIGPNEIEAIEVYSSAARVPAQYNKTSGGCGVMLIWTRDGKR